MSDNEVVTRIKLLIDERAAGVKKDFAEALGVWPSQIDNWVNKGGLPSAEHLANFAKKLNVNINWLLTGEGPMYIEDSHSPMKTPELSLRSLKIGELYENADDELRKIVDSVLAIAPKTSVSGGKKK